MKNFHFFLLLATGLIFWGCSHTTELIKEDRIEYDQDLSYSITYYIHADSDYLYHTPNGKSVRGNTEVLSTALEVGEAARSGEVFVYYQRSEKKLLGLFPRKRSRLYHYVNGQLINHLKFRHPDKDEAFLATEARFSDQFRVQNRAEDHQNYFLYFGHELPLKSNSAYHRSLPKIVVNPTSFAKGIQNFLLSDDDRFDLVVLSTCNNGTPAMAELLSPFTDAMLASPQNLHLSHFDSDKMNLLEDEPDTNPMQIARSMAEQTFQRLDTTIHTTITLALYDFEEIRPYIHTLSSLTSANSVTDRSAHLQDNVDCAEMNAFEPGTYRQGVETWYKPARFGRQTGRSTHSGWGCKPGVK